MLFDVACGSFQNLVPYNLIIRILLFRVLYWNPYFRKLPCASDAGMAQSVNGYGILPDSQILLLVWTHVATVDATS